MLIQLNKIDNANYIVKNISAINMIPKNKVLSHEEFGRILNGFLYIISGSCKYEFAGKSFIMHEGSLVYLPKGSKHKYIALTDIVRYIRIDFDLYDSTTDNEIIFSEFPCILFDKTPYHYESIIYKLSDTFISGTYGSKFMINSLLYEILSKLSAHYRNELNDSPYYSLILPCIEYIEMNYRNSISTNTLSKICNLSDSHFRRIFKSVTGRTPTEYRTKLRIEKACILLNNQTCSIGEISDQLGFESVFYFSRTFKKIMGISPIKYKNNY